MRVRAVVAVIAAAGLALPAAGCGGSPGSDVAQLGSAATTTPSRTSSISAASTQGSGAIAYARCLRSNGVPHWPDPDSSGVFDKSKLTLQRLGAERRPDPGPCVRRDRSGLAEVPERERSLPGVQAAVHPVELRL